MEKWWIGMRERYDWSDSVLNAGIDQIIVMLQRRGVDWATSNAERHDAGPRDTERIIRHTNRCETGDVLLVEIVIHVRNHCVYCILRATKSANLIQGARSTTIVECSAFDLPRAASNAP